MEESISPSISLNQQHWEGHSCDVMTFWTSNHGFQIMDFYWG